MDKSIRTKWDGAMFIYAAFEIFLFGGITYGWPNLVRALKEEQFFFQGCQINDDNNSTNSFTNITEADFQREESCTSQDDTFGLIYNIASVVTGIGNILIGTAVDKLPTILTRFIFILFFLIGSLCTAFSSHDSWVLLAVGMLFVRIGGFMVYYANMRLANAAPKIKGTIITIYAGLFDSSSSVLYIILTLYKSGIKVQTSFFAYALSLVLPFCLTFLLFPMRKISDDGTFKRFPQMLRKIEKPGTEKKAYVDNTDNLSNIQDYSENDANEKSNQSNLDNGFHMAVVPEESRYNQLKLWLISHNLTFMLDVKFYFFLFVLSVLTLRKEFFVISYDASLTHSANGDRKLVHYYTTVFGVVQFFAILVTPIGGITIDYSRSRGSLMAYVWQFAFTLLCGSLLCVCAFIEPIEVLYAANILYVVCRALTYSIAAAYISDTYPMKMFGSILGITETVGYILSLVQYPLFAWSNGPLSNDYRPANGIMLALCLLANAHPIRLFFYYRSQNKKRKAAAADVPNSSA